MIKKSRNGGLGGSIYTLFFGCIAAAQVDSQKCTFLSRVCWLFRISRVCSSFAVVYGGLIWFVSLSPKWQALEIDYIQKSIGSCLERGKHEEVGRKEGGG